MLHLNLFFPLPKRLQRKAGIAIDEMPKRRAQIKKGVKNDFSRIRTN
jgi:hypothetical protein